MAAKKVAMMAVLMVAMRVAWKECATVVKKVVELVAKMVA